MAKGQQRSNREKKKPKADKPKKTNAAYVSSTDLNIAKDMHKSSKKGGNS